MRKIDFWDYFFIAIIGAWAILFFAYDSVSLVFFALTIAAIPNLLRGRVNDKIYSSSRIIATVLAVGWFAYFFLK